MASLRTFSTVCVILNLLLAVSFAAVVPHDCKVDLCKDAAGTTDVGTCDATTGDCECNGGQFNYNCRTTVDKGAGDVATDCPNCHTAGTYYCDPTGGTGTCICAEGYYNEPGVAEDCSLTRMRVTCSTIAMNQVDFSFLPYSTFTGLAYIVSSDGTCDPTSTECGQDKMCLLTDSSGTWIYDNYPYTGTPPANCPAANEVSGTTPIQYSWKVIVQYTSNLQTEADLEFTVTCTEPAVGETESLADISVVSATAPARIADNVMADIPSGITMDIEQSSGSIAGGTVTVGTVIDIKFDLTIGSYDEFSVTTLVAANYPSIANPVPATDAVAVKLLDNACVHTDAARLVTSLTKTDDGTNVVITYSLKTFSIEVQAAGYVDPNPPTGTVYIWADVCLGTCTRAPATCDLVTDAVIGDNLADIIAAGTGRRRRSTDNLEDGSHVNLNVSFVVLDPRLQTGAAAYYPHTTTSSDCYQSAAFLLPLILMGVVLVLSVISTFYFFTKVTRSKRGLEEGHTNMAYK